jgi:hypothetical protein
MPGTLHDRPDIPVPRQFRSDFISQLWPEPSPRSYGGDEANWDAFFNYYERECRAALADEGRHFGARNHKDILRWAKAVRTEPKRDDVRDSILADFEPPQTPNERDDTERKLEGSVKISARILAMVNVGTLQFNASKQRQVEWESGQSLCEAIKNHFHACTSSFPKDIVFSPQFTACGHIREARIGILWTDNLADHLRLVNHDSKICVFHHVSFLTRMKDTQRLVIVF